MSNVFNQNFMLGFLIAKDRPREEAISAGLQLSQAPANNVVSVVLAKKNVDRITELENTNTSQAEEITRLQARIKELEPKPTPTPTPTPAPTPGDPPACDTAVIAAVDEAFAQVKVAEAATDAIKEAVQARVDELRNRVVSLLCPNQKPPGIL